MRLIRIKLNRRKVVQDLVAQTIQGSVVKVSIISKFYTKPNNNVRVADLTGEATLWTADYRLPGM